MGGAAVDIHGKANVTVINGVMSAGVSTGCNSAGTTGTVSNQLIFCGGNNITLSESINGQSATITIIGGAGGAGTTFSAGVSNLSNDSGQTGIVTNQIVFAGGNNITLSQASNVGGSATITIIGGAGGAANIGIAAGSQTATSGTVLFQDANSISFGMNNSSLITASYEMQSHNSVYHTGIIGAESQISFDPVAGHDHDGVDSKLIITPQYLEVSEVAGVGESGKQFTSIATAIAAAVAGIPSVSKPYVIKVYPGTYTEPQLVMVSYVAVIGSGMYNTIITALDPTNHFIIGATNSYIRDCAIVGPTTNFMAAIYHDKISSSPFTVQDVFIRQGYYGVWANSATTGGNVHCINVNNWYLSTATIMHTFMYATDFGTIVAISSTFMCGPPAKITRGFACDGPNAEIYMDLCSFRNTPTIPLPNDAVFVDNGGKVKLVACTLSIGTNAIHVGANGTGGYVIAVGCNIRNEPAMGYVFTKDILMDSAGTLQFTGSCDKTKITITNPGAATFSANFTDSTTGEEGSVTVGEAWLGFTVANSIPLRDYGLTAYSSGWKIGGAVTRSGVAPSLDVSVALGSGYINTGTGVTRISWGPAATIKTCVANASQWVYVDSAGTVTVSIIEPNYPDVILLAALRTNLTHVVFLTNHDISLHQTVPTIYNYLEKIFGPVSFEGCTVAQTAGIGNELKVDFAVGKYYCGLQELQPATTSPVTFTYWYRKVGSSGWNTATPGGGGSNFDTTQYDDNSGALAPLPGGKYKKDLLIVVKNDVGTEFHVIYGQQYFDTADQAQVTHVFEIPDPIQEHGLQVAGIVVLSGAGVIASIIDERNKFVSGHNDLRELQGGDSIVKQYYHLNYNEWSSRNQKIVVSLLTAGNTAGAMAVISTGTMYLAGGNNITLSQNANSVTISGPNMAIAAGGVTTAASTFTFGDTNGVSFQISNGSIVGSIGTYLTSQSNQALSGSNTSFTFQTATFGDSNGLKFYVTNGSMVGSYTVPTQSVQTDNILSPLAIVGNTAGTNYTLAQGAYSLSGGNMLTLSQNSSSTNVIVLSVNTASLLGTGATVSFRFTSDDGNLQFTSANTKFIQEWELEGANVAGTTSSSQGSRLYLSGGNMMTLSGNSNTIVFSVNTASLLGTGATASFRFTSDDGNLQFTSANTKFVQAWELEGVQTAGTTSSSQGTQLYLSGGNMMTLSGNSNTIVFSMNSGSLLGTGATASFRFTSDDGNLQFTSANTKFVQAWELEGVQTAGTTSSSQGTQLYLSGGNMMTLSGNSNTIIFSVNTASLLGTGIKQTLGLTDTTAGGGTGGTAGGASGNAVKYVFVAGSNVTLSQSLDIGNASGTLSIYAANPSGAGIAAIGNTASSNAFTSGSVIFSASTNITINTSANGASQYIQLSVADPAAAAGVSAIANSETTYTSGLLILSEYANITISSSVNAGSQYYRFSVAAGGGDAIRAISGSNASISDSTVTFGSSNNMHFYITNGSVVGSFSESTHAHPYINTSVSSEFMQIWELEGVQTAGTTSSSQGSILYLSGGNMMTLSGNSNTIVFSMNSASLLGTGAAASFRYTSDDGQLQYTSANTKFVQAWELEGANVAGTTSSSQGTQLYLSGGNMMTLSGNSNTIVFSVNTASLLGTGAAASFRYTSDDGNLQFTSANTKFVQGWELEGVQTAGTTSSSQGTQLYLSGGNMMTLSGNSNTIVFSMNSASLLGTGATASFQFTSANTKFVQGWELEGVQTAGTTSSSQGTQLYLSGGNMMTLSGNSNTIVFSMNSASLLGTGAAASFRYTSDDGQIQFTSANTKFVQGWELEGLNTAGTTSSSQGTQLYLSGGNMVTLSGNSNTIVVSVAGIGGIAGSAASTVVGGIVQFQTGNGITFGLNGSTMTASHNALTSQSTAPSGLYASAIATTFTSGIIGFSGSNNITVSTAAQAIIISGPNTHAVQVGISSIGAAGTTYTSGGVSLYGSGIISLSSTTGQGFVISAAGVISLNGSSSTLTIMAGNNMSISNVAGASQISIINLLSSSVVAQPVSSASSAGALASRFALADHAHAGVGGLGVSNIGTTLGTTNTFAGTWVIAASGNITASGSTTNTALGVNTIWLSVPAQSAQTGISSIGVVGSEQTFTSGNVIFSGLANITINTTSIGASQYIRISAPAPGAAVAKVLSYWDNAMGETASGGFGLKTFQQNMLWVFPLDIADRYFPGDMTVNTMMLNMSASGSSATLSAAFTTAVRFALYERTNATQLTLRNSVLTSYTKNAATDQSSLWVGQRWWTIHSSVWSVQPTLAEGGIYYGALMMSSAGSSGATFQVIGNYGYSTASRSGTFGVTSASATSRGFNLFFGHYGTTTGVFPNFINYNQINKASASGNFQPHLVFNNLTGVV